MNGLSEEAIERIIKQVCQQFLNQSKILGIANLEEEADKKMDAGIDFLTAVRNGQSSLAWLIANEHGLAHLVPEDWNTNV